MAGSSEDAAHRLGEARTGSREALGQALEACRDYLLRVANDELGSGLEAKGGASDIVQQTFLEAQRDFAQFHGATEDELLAWLRRLLLHNVADFTRRYRRTRKRQLGREVAFADDSTAPEPTADTPSPSSHARADEHRELLEQALARLPEDYRRIMVLRYQEERSFEEIARLMQRSENAVRKLWLRAVERLRQQMEPPP